MNENQNVDIDREQDNGQITYANEVISTIVSVATTEVDGISAIAGNSGLPAAVAINEAVELTRKYSGEESCPFVNGVLGTISRKLAAQA